MELEAVWYDDAEWRGYVALDSRTDLLDRHVVVTWVAGLSHLPDAARHPDFAPGRVLSIRPEPSNTVDPEAVAIWDESFTVQAGYLPVCVRSEMHPWAGERHGLAMAEMIDGDTRCGLWIIVAREPVTLEVTESAGHRRRIRATVKAEKDANRRFEGWKSLKAVDPMEQMRAMAAGLRSV